MRLPTFGGIDQDHGTCGDGWDDIGAGSGDIVGDGDGITKDDFEGF